MESNPYAVVAVGLVRQQQHALVDIWPSLGYMLLGQCLGAGAAVGYASIIAMRERR